MTSAVLVPLAPRLARRERFAATRAAYAAALRRSGELAGAPRELPYGDWPREPSGAPAVVDGWHASLADTRGLAAALVSRAPAALDAEWRLRPRWEAARARFQERGELARLGATDRDAVLALWCATEALLKLARVGLAGLARCRLLAREADRFRLALDGEPHDVRVVARGEHWIACAGGEASGIALRGLEESP